MDTYEDIKRAVKDRQKSRSRASHVHLLQKDVLRIWIFI